MDPQREPHRAGLRGRHPAADRLNLIRVMPAQGWWRGPPAGPAHDCGKAIVPRTLNGTSGSDDDVVVPLRRSRSRDGGRDDAGRRDGRRRGDRAGLRLAGGPPRAAGSGPRARPARRGRHPASPRGCSPRWARPTGARRRSCAWRSPRPAPGRGSPRSSPRDSGLESGYEPRGALHVALDRDESEELRRRFELMASLDLGVEWLRPRGCRDLEPGLVAGLRRGRSPPGEAAVDPRLLVPALAAAVERSRRPGARRGRGRRRPLRGRPPRRGGHRGRAGAPRRARGAGDRGLVGSRRLAAAASRARRCVR